MSLSAPIVDCSASPVSCGIVASSLNGARWQIDDSNFCVPEDALIADPGASRIRCVLKSQHKKALIYLAGRAPEGRNRSLKALRCYGLRQIGDYIRAKPHPEGRERPQKCS